MSTKTSLLPAEAQGIVEGIAKKYGWLPESVRNSTPEEALGAIANLQDVLGAAARTLAEDLYNSKARFVFELIQNAEDNDYNQLAGTSVDPYIHFSIFPDKIVIENNEDGFSAANVDSICKIAASTKVRTDSHYYIGEKGIGFKSVFMVASKVHIEMGMITPIQYSPNRPLEVNVTRMTLILRKDLDPENTEKQFFEDLPDTLLLFLQKLRRIIIDKYDTPTIVSRRESYTCSFSDDNRRAELTQISHAGINQPKFNLRRYFIAKTLASSLPDHHQRESNSAEIVLAFPIDADDRPVVGRQGIYSYLPLDNLTGFPFLIQSDFITQANRQSVVDCSRNRAILDEIARAFVDSILRFCVHPTLRYQWMQYLPDSCSDSFWANLLPSIKGHLQHTPVIYSNACGPLKLIKQLRIVPDKFKDAFLPLFADSLGGTYIASQYRTGPDINKLVSLGLQRLQPEDVIERIQQDLGSPESKLKSKSTSSEWHVCVAKFLLEASNGRCIPLLQNVQFIPLESGDFASLSDRDIFFPTSNGILLPSDLGLKMVQLQAINENDWRKKLFSEVGVTEMPVEAVRQLVLAKYTSSDIRKGITLPQSIAHLHFLYFTHDHHVPVVRSTGPTLGTQLAKRGGSPAKEKATVELGKERFGTENSYSLQLRTSSGPVIIPPIGAQPATDPGSSFGGSDNTNPAISGSLLASPFSPETEASSTSLSLPPSPREIYKEIFVFSQYGLVSCRNDVYLPSMDEFCVQELLKPLPSCAPTVSVRILSASYVFSVPKSCASGGQTWESWLCEEVGFRKEPRLTALFDRGGLSNIFMYLAKSKPDKFLGTLKSHWKTYEVLMTRKLRAQISLVKIQCQNGRYIELGKILHPVLESCAQEFLCGKEKLPFPILYPNSKAEEWMFLTTFGIEAVDNIEYYLAVLGCIRKENDNATEAEAPERIFRLYEAIYGKYDKAKDKKAAGHRIRSYFQSNECIYSLRGSANWCSPSSCVWEGPEYLTYKDPLERQTTYCDNPILVSLLQDTLQIPNASIEILMEELEHERDKCGMLADQANVSDIYRRLDSKRQHLETDELESIEESFEEEQLVFHSAKGWCSIKNCVWSEHDSIKGKANISSEYPTLRSFFVDFLDVKIPDMKMLVKQLAVVATSSTQSVQAAKKLILQINSLNPSIKDLKTIRRLPIFPVKVGRKKFRLEKKDQDFAIMDCKRFATAFTTHLESGYLAMLDFLDIEDVHNLHPFISACQIEDRYLSNKVSELSCMLNIDPGPSLDLVFTMILRNRAHALFRCASHWRSPRTLAGDKSLYTILLHAQAFLTNNTSTILRVRQNDEDIVAKDYSNTSCVEEIGSKLRVYLPEDSKHHELCCRRRLPAMLLEKLMRTSGGDSKQELKHERVALVADILACSDLIIDDILEDAGIVEAPFAAESIPEATNVFSLTESEASISWSEISSGSSSEGSSKSSSGSSSD